LFARKAALIGVFASLHATLYFIPLLWRSCSILLIPLEGIILGPKAGYLSALIGSAIARAIEPGDFWMFGIFAEPIGVLAASLLSEGKWKHVLTIYGVMLAAYFIHPLSWHLPLWTILDILFAPSLIYPAAKSCKKIFEESSKRLFIFLVLISFISTAADSLARIFLFIPMGLSHLFFASIEEIHDVFILGAVRSYAEDIIAIVASPTVGVPLLLALRKIPETKYLLSFREGAAGKKEP